MDDTSAGSGSYPIERRPGEVERLKIQDRAWTPETETLLDTIGVVEGWSCLDIGCGPGGITKELSARVGENGVVLGLDFDPGFVAVASADASPNTRYVQGDAYRTGLPEGGFDLVHTRFLASTAGQPERLVNEAVRLVRPGGFVAYQEAAFYTLKCYPSHPAWEKLARLFSACFPQPDGESIAYQIYRLLRAEGLEDAHCRPCVLAVRTQDKWRDYLPSTVESMRGTITGRLGVSDGELDRLLADCRAHLSQPDTFFTSYTCVQTWARKRAT